MLLFPSENAYPLQRLNCVWSLFVLTFSVTAVLSQDAGGGSILRLWAVLHSLAILGKDPKPWKLYTCSSKHDVWSRISSLHRKWCSSLQFSAVNPKWKLLFMQTCIFLSQFNAVEVMTTYSSSLPGTRNFFWVRYRNASFLGSDLWKLLMYCTLNEQAREVFPASILI